MLFLVCHYRNITHNHWARTAQQAHRVQILCRSGSYMTKGKTCVCTGVIRNRFIFHFVFSKNSYDLCHVSRQQPKMRTKEMKWKWWNEENSNLNDTGVVIGCRSYLILSCEYAFCGCNRIMWIEIGWTNYTWLTLLRESKKHSQSLKMSLLAVLMRYSFRHFLMSTHPDCDRLTHIYIQFSFTKTAKLSAQHL